MKYVLRSVYKYAHTIFRLNISSSVLFRFCPRVLLVLGACLGSPDAVVAVQPGETAGLPSARPQFFQTAQEGVWRGEVRPSCRATAFARCHAVNHPMRFGINSSIVLQLLLFTRMRFWPQCRIYRAWKIL